MTTASKITLVRVFMIPVYLVTMYLSAGQSNVWMWASLAIFIIASLTDFVDGYIARHYNQTSDFGKFLDPLADKLLTLAAMCMFCEWGTFPAWALMIIQLCEILDCQPGDLMEYVREGVQENK